MKKHYSRQNMMSTESYDELASVSAIGLTQYQAFYLASEVDGEMILKDAIIAELKQAVATLNKSNIRLRQKIDRLTS